MAKLKYITSPYIDALRCSEYDRTSCTFTISFHLSTTKFFMFLYLSSSKIINHPIPESSRNNCSIGLFGKGLILSDFQITLYMNTITVLQKYLRKWSPIIHTRAKYIVLQLKITILSAYFALLNNISSQNIDFS